MNELYLGSDRPKAVLIQVIDLYDIDWFYKTINMVLAHTRRFDLGFYALCCQRSRHEMGPWEIQPFRDGWFSFGYGKYTLEDLQNQLINPIRSRQCMTRFYLGGYGLSGLFALWCAYQSRDFSGVAAISPSIWYPGFLDYTETHQPFTKRIYLSIGWREIHVREPVRRFNAKNALTDLYDKLVMEDEVDSILEESFYKRKSLFAERMARGFEWLLSRERRDAGSLR